MMKTASLFFLFLLILFLGLIGLPAISLMIVDNFIQPEQKIGNAGFFGDGLIGIIFPGFNNSYITYDPILMEKPDRMDFINGSEDIPDKTYDVVIIGDSFTYPRFGFSNGICRLGNYSTITFNLQNLKADSHFKLVENLISSGFIESAKPKFILIESAGRNDMSIFGHESNDKERIVYDIQSLNFWIRYGDRIDDIVTGINPKTRISLLNLSMERTGNDIPDRGEPWRVKTYGGEPALYEEPLPGDYATARFSRISIPQNTTLLTKAGLDPKSWKQGHTDGVRFVILAAGDDGIEKIVYDEFVYPGQEFRLVVIPMDSYGGKTVNLTFATSTGENGNRDWAYWINPTLISNSAIPMEPGKETKGEGTIRQILQIPAVLTKFHEKPLLSYIWDKTQYDAVFRVRVTIINTIKNQFDISFDERFHKVRLTKRVHSSNVEYDTIYYYYGEDRVRETYSPEKLKAANSNFNNLSERLKDYNVTLLVLKPPGTSHIYEDYYLHPPEPKASGIYKDLENIPKKYHYIDAYGILKERADAGELDLYPVGTTHWAPSTGAYVAAETVRVMNNSTSGIQNAL